MLCLGRTGTTTAEAIAWSAFLSEMGNSPNEALHSHDLALGGGIAPAAPVSPLEAAF